MTMNIFQLISHFLTHNQIFTLFLCLGLGYIIGNIKIAGRFALGSTVGTLIVGLLIGQVGTFPRDEMLGTIFFATFMFAIGYRIGPQFMISLRMFGRQLITVALIWLVMAFAVGYGLFKLFHIGPGVAAGTVAGALTQSATIEGSLQTIAHLPLHISLIRTYEAQLPVAYALTYVFGTLGAIVFLRDLAPKIVGIDYAERGPAMAIRYHFHAKNPNPTWRRTYKIEKGSNLVGNSIRWFNRQTNSDLIVLAAFHGRNYQTDHLEYEFWTGDLVTIIGYADHFNELKQFTGLTETLTPTTAPRERKFVLGKHFHPAQLALLRQHGVFVNLQDPISGNDQLVNQLRAGDVITLTGNTSRTAVLVSRMGHWHHRSTAINYSLFSFGIAGAAALGMLGIHVNGITLQLGNGTAALIMGLLLSTIIDRHRDHNSIPLTVTSFFQSFGLALYVATVGLSSGAAFTGAVKSLGIGILFIGAVLTIAPHFLTLLIGKYLLHVEPLALIAALCGAGTTAASMGEVVNQAGREGGAYVAASFTPAFVVGNIGLTLLGPLMVAVLA